MPESERGTIIWQGLGAIFIDGASYPVEKGDKLTLRDEYVVMEMNRDSFTFSHRKTIKIEDAMRDLKFFNKSNPKKETVKK